MDREGVLPDRCVACNQPAGHRLRRRFYVSPLLWRLGAFAAPFVALVIGIATQTEVLIMAFWPIAIVLALAHLLVRRSLRLEYGICARHRRQRHLLIALSILCMLGVPAGIFGFRSIGPALLLGSLLGLLVLMIVQSTRALRLRSLTAQHAWLSGTGEPFRSRLPELN
jgi:hypothetical protein